jgi:phosphoglucosamine mutase
MGRKYFGTDGVRGRVGEEPITPQFVMRLGYAAGRVLAQQGQTGRPTVLIGKDTRISGYMLEAALEAGFAAAGVDVLLSGPLPTPGVAYLTRALRLSAGVVISASHNAYDDNGIKFFSGDGNKLPDADRRAHRVRARRTRWAACAPTNSVKARRMEDAAGRYIEFCKSSFPFALDLRGLKMVVDCAHGAAYHTAPHVFHELGADVITIGDKPNGLNINEERRRDASGGAGRARCASTRPMSALRSTATPIGLVLVDGDGRVYNGDELLYVIVADRLRDRIGRRRRGHADVQPGARAVAGATRCPVPAGQGG